MSTSKTRRETGKNPIPRKGIQNSNQQKVAKKKSPDFPNANPQCHASLPVQAVCSLDQNRTRPDHFPSGPCRVGPLPSLSLRRAGLVRLERSSPTPFRPRRLYRRRRVHSHRLVSPPASAARTCETGEGDRDAAARPNPTTTPPPPPRPRRRPSSPPPPLPPPPRHPPAGVRAQGFPRDEGLLLGVQYAAGVRGRGVCGGAARRAPLRRRPRRHLLQRRHRSLADDAAAAARRPGSRGGFSVPGDASRRPVPPQASPPARRGRRRRRRRRWWSWSPDAPSGRRVCRRGRHRDLPGEGDGAAERGAGVHGGRDEPVRRRRRRGVRDRGDPRAVRVVQLGEPGGPARVPAAGTRRLPPQRRPPTPRRRDRLLRVHQLLPLQALRLRCHLRRPRRPIAAGRSSEEVEKQKERKKSKTVVTSLPLFFFFLIPMSVSLTEQQLTIATRRAVRTPNMYETLILLVDL